MKKTKIGAFYTPSLTEFIVWAPLRRQVELVLEPPQGNRSSGRSFHSMEKDESGYWKTALPVMAGTRYQFRLDGGRILPDPASISQPEGVHGASCLINRAEYDGEMAESEGETQEGLVWQGLPLSNMIIYELHTGIFSATHDFAGVVDKLDHLVTLGVNAIELMPLAQFSGKRNWGYDGVYPFAIQNTYGGREGFIRLVRAAHARGIAVIVDVVYNHLGPEGAFLPEYGPYLTDKYHTPWGKAINFDDAWSDGVRNYFLQNAWMWLEELGADALRLDAVHAICDLSAKPFIRQLKEEALEISHATGCRKEIIAELDLNDIRYLHSPEQGGYGLDGQWNDEFHHALHALLTGERNGYYEDFGEIGHLEKAFRETFVYNGNYSVHRKRTFGSPVGNTPYSQFVVFAQNHDHVGNRARGDRLSASLSPEQLRLAAATVLLSPYIPLLFMGEEYGEKNPFLFFTDFSDPDLIEAVRKGRAAEFRHAPGELTDPQDPLSFACCVLGWKEKEGDAAALFNFYRRLIHFRKTRPALQGAARDTMVMHPSKENVLFFERKIVTDHLFIWLNFSAEEKKAKNEMEHALQQVFDSNETEWTSRGGLAGRTTGESHTRVIPPGGEIRLAPYSASVFENES